MKLQADPTVAYLASGGAGVLDHQLKRAELDRDDPFNTYRSTGLPPGPICSPGAAVCMPWCIRPNSDDLYFVADGAGGHIFSRSYAQHDSAVARMRALAPSATHGGRPDLVQSTRDRPRGGRSRSRTPQRCATTVAASAMAVSGQLRREAAEESWPLPSAT